MIEDESDHRCSTCGAKLQPSPDNGQLVCLLCAYQPVREISESRIEILEDPYVELQKQLREERKIATFIQGLNASTKDVYVTKGIVGINILVFLIMVSSGVNSMLPQTKDVIDWGGNLSSFSMFGEPWRLFTCMFLHIGIIHLFFNMMVLWTLGDFVEKLFGHVNFLLLYIFSGLIGSLASVVWNPNVVSAGASGAVFGVFGGLCGYLVMCKKEIPQGIFGEMKKNVFLFLGLNLAFGFSVPNIDMAAHLGGLVGGFLAALVLSHSFSAEGVKTVKKRGLIFGIIGILILLVSFKTISSEFKIPFEHTYQNFLALENKYPKLLEKSQQELGNKKIGLEEFIGVLKDEIIPGWEKTRVEFIENRPFGLSNTSFEKIDKYMTLKGQIWNLRLKGYEENTDKYSTQIEEIGKQIQKMNKK